jgi:hypothetical protein
MCGTVKRVLGRLLTLSALTVRLVLNLISSE